MELSDSDRQLIAEHPRLYHYTTIEGLQGIVSSNQLFATHYRFLNDTRELLISSELLEEDLLPIYEERIRRHTESDPEAHRELHENGGLDQVAKMFSRNLIQNMYQVKDGNGIFLTSFCGTPQSDHVRKNGLLSQWRAYGGVGGYCLEFDTQKLLILLKEEAEIIEFEGNVGSVSYSHQKQQYLEENKERLVHIQNYANALALSDAILSGCTEPPDSGEALPAFLSFITFYKHRGFSEEREVRIRRISSTFL